jgi:CDP-diacylglycerol--glycerol-3-phosphate 3-phosphatidyltransferase
MINVNYLANTLSISRALFVPFLILAAIQHKPFIFLSLYAVALFTDVIDGYIVRKYGQPSELGAQLDSWADFFVYSVLPFCAWMLWPDIILSNMLFVIIALVSYFLPVIIGFAKFKQLPSYHTWSAKIAAILMTTSIYIMLGLNNSLIFKIAAIYQSLVALENILITFHLTSHQSNIKSYFHLRHEQ